MHNPLQRGDYQAIWRVAKRRLPEKRLEVLDRSIASFWGAGDLNGDSIAEIIAMIPDAEPDPNSVRYELIDVAAGARVVLAERAAVGDRYRGDTEPVYGVSLRSGEAVVVEGRILHYVNGALVAAPESAKEELYVASEAMRERIEGALRLIDQPLAPLDEAAPCLDLPRARWVLAFSRELVAIGPWDEESARLIAEELARGDRCDGDSLGR